MGGTLHFHLYFCKHEFRNFQFPAQLQGGGYHWVSGYLFGQQIYNTQGGKKTRFKEPV